MPILLYLMWCHNILFQEILAKLLNNDSDQFTNKETTVNESNNTGKKKLESFNYQAVQLR